MPMSLQGRRSINLQPVLLGVGFALLIAISAGTAVLVTQAQTDSRLRAQSLNIQDKLSDVLLDVRRAESGQRGYLFTGETKYLDDFAAAEPDAIKQIVELRELTKDTPRRKQELDRISDLVRLKLEELRKTVSLHQRGDIEGARAEVLSGEGRDLMTSIRELTSAIIADEQQTINARTDQSNFTNNLLLIVSLLGAALIIVIGALSVALVQRNARRAENARQELASTNANLERIVAFRTADLTEANEEIQRFAYIVSHDLRSPLVNVMGFTSELEALRKDIFERVEKLREELAALNAQAAEAEGQSIEQVGKDFDEAIGFIKTSIANMDRLINAVLKLSREGRRQFNPEAIDMGVMFDQIAQTVSHRAAEMGAELDIGELPEVESDRLAIQQIFANLVDNALKYSRPDVPVRIAVRGRATSTKVEYDVEDNGRGIDKSDHQRVFELFRRAGRQDRPGEGIGLAHVRALVRRLGGTMKLNSELGKGSTFTVTLPRWWSADNRSAA